MQNVFIDWGATKPHLVLLEENPIPQPVNSEDLLENYAPFNAYLEAGCPHKLLYDLIAKGCEIYSCDSHSLVPLRGIEAKTDENDVILIRKLWQTNPKNFQQMPLPQRKDIQLSFIMRQYLQFMKEVVRFKRRQMSYEKEFGCSPSYINILKSLEEQKKLKLNMLKPMLKEEMVKIEDIKGIGLRYLAGLLATAHPKRFSTLSKYLSYCGYKESSWRKGSGKYNREAKCLAWQMSKSIILHKDPKFYPLYLKFKDDLRAKNVDCSKSRINGKAINRTSTFILKELYARFHN